MKIILREDVERLGVKDSLVEASDGYARNFLIPKGLASAATPGEVKNWKERKRVAQTKQEKEKFRAKKLEEKLKDTQLVIEKEVGQGGKLFGSVTTQDIAAQIKKKFNIPVEHRKIVLEEPIKVIGIREVSIKLHPEVEIPLKVEVKKKDQENE